jgi:hypothetical protein
MNHRALGRLPVGQMNKTETSYAQELENRRLVGEISWYKFEGLKFRLADNCFLTPDFAVMLRDGQMEVHEVKGFMEGDAAVKLKVAASIYPFTFRLVRARAKRDGGGWEITEI